MDQLKSGSIFLSRFISSDWFELCVQTYVYFFDVIDVCLSDLCGYYKVVCDDFNA